MDIALFVLRLLTAIALLAFAGALLAALLRERGLDAAAPPPRARLRATAKDEGGARQHSLDTPAWIGRDPNCAILLRHDSVSSRHARLDWRAQHARWFVEDNVSRNGTFVNGERVSQRALADGDRVKVGAVEFVFEIEPLSPAGS